LNRLKIAIFSGKDLEALTGKLKETDREKEDLVVKVSYFPFKMSRGFLNISFSTAS
jgi:hypothetical protein